MGLGQRTGAWETGSPLSVEQRKGEGMTLAGSLLEWMLHVEQIRAQEGKRVKKKNKKKNQGNREKKSGHSTDTVRPL